MIALVSGETGLTSKKNKFLIILKYMCTRIDLTTEQELMEGEIHWDKVVGVLKTNPGYFSYPIMEMLVLLLQPLHIV